VEAEDPRQVEAEGMEAEGMEAEGMEAEGMGAEGMEAEGMEAEGMEAEVAILNDQVLHRPKNLPDLNTISQFKARIGGEPGLAGLTAMTAMCTGHLFQLGNTMLVACPGI
jgi:hypothetical protein